MKKSINILYASLLWFLALMVIVACETTADTYSEFTKGGEKIYVGTPDTVIVAHGFEKLQFSVVINADPKITNGILQTKDKSISHEFDIIRKNLAQDTITFNLDLNEGEYNFDIILKDDAGNQSIPREITTVVYGDKYKTSLPSRSIANIKVSEKTAIINWENPPEKSISTMFSFENADGIMQTLEIPNDSTNTILESYKLGGKILISSSFKPAENAIEIFNSLTETTFPDEFVLDHTRITALRLPFDASDGCHGSSYARLTDGSTNEYWHSCESPEDQYPWVMSFDLGVTAKVKGFRIDKRSDCCGDRTPGTYQIWGTNDLTGAETQDIDDPADPTVVNEAVIADWEADAVAKGWVKLLDVTNNTDHTFETAIENTTNYRYIRIVGISSISGHKNANFNEFTFFATEVE